MPQYKTECDDCPAMANLSFPDGPAYCNTHARAHGHADLLDLTWHQRIIKSDPTGRWREIFKQAGYSA